MNANQNIVFLLSAKIRGKFSPQINADLKAEFGFDPAFIRGFIPRHPRSVF